VGWGWGGWGGADEGFSGLDPSLSVIGVVCVPRQLTVDRLSVSQSSSLSNPPEHADRRFTTKLSFTDIGLLWNESGTRAGVQCHQGIDRTARVTQLLIPSGIQRCFSKWMAFESSHSSHLFVNLTQ